MIGDIQISRRNFGMLASGFTAALLVAGCSGPTGSAGGGGTTDTKRLRIAVASEPTTIHLLRDSEATAELLAYNVYETLTRIGDDGKAAPLLAESWETVDKTFVAKLRQDVTFHDGTPMKAADVAASFNAAIAGKNNVVAGMTSAEARDDYTVVVNTDTVNIEVPLLVSRLIIVPASLADTDALEDKMVGTGPYSFSKWDRGRQIEFTKNDKYWGTPATFDVLTWTFTSDSAVRANSLKAGEVDIAHDLSTDDAAQLPNTVSGPVSQVLCMRVKYAPGQPLETRTYAWRRRWRSTRRRSSTASTGVGRACRTGTPSSGRCSAPIPT